MQRFLVWTVTILASAAFTSTMAAQNVDPPAQRPVLQFVCGSGLPGGGPQCRPERRLVYQLVYRGEPGTDAQRQLRSVIHLGASQAGTYALDPEQAEAQDSALFAIVEVDYTSRGDYQVGMRLAGPQAPGRRCGSQMSGRASDLVFGALMVSKVAQLTQCAQAIRQASAEE